MKKFTETYYQNLKTTCHYCTIVLFGIGTLIFLFYLTNKVDKTIIIGLYYTVIAILINTILFTFNTLCALFTNKYWKNYLINSGILLLNAPIALFYFYVVIEKIKF